MIKSKIFDSRNLELLTKDVNKFISKLSEGELISINYIVKEDTTYTLFTAIVTYKILGNK